MNHVGLGGIDATSKAFIIFDHRVAFGNQPFSPDFRQVRAVSYQRADLLPIHWDCTVWGTIFKASRMLANQLPL
jgi:hypothetical protein